MTLSVALVGPGAIGTTVAAALHQAGRTPALCGRSARDQLELYLGDGRVIVPGPVITDPSRVNEAVDLVFLAVKATQVQAAAPWLQRLCRAKTVVCVLQNGVEQEAMVAPLLPSPSRVVPSVVWFPAQARSDGSVLLRGDARLTVPSGLSEIVAEALRGSFCTVEVASDFLSVAWRKLLQNAVAGLMALTGRRAGVFHREDLGKLALAYLGECLAVARAEGAVLANEVPAEILAGFRACPPDLGSSILADREAGRPLEWSIRNEVVIRRGKAHGIETPISEMVVALLAAVSDGPG